MTKQENKHKARNKEPNRVDIKDDKGIQGRPQRRDLHEPY